MLKKLPSYEKFHLQNQINVECKIVKTRRYIYQIYNIEIKSIFESNKKLKEDFNLSLKFSRLGYVCTRNGNYSSMGQIIHISLAILIPVA